jgi:subtilisin family serine protease
MKKELLTLAVITLMVFSSICVAGGKITNNSINTSSISEPFDETVIYGEFVPGEIIIGFKDTISVSKNQEIISLLIESENGVLKETDNKLNLVKVDVEPGTEISFIENIKHDPNVKYAEPNYLAYASVIPNDPRWNQQYGPANIKCPEGWDESTGSSNVVIAIIDTGVDYTHEDLADDIVDGYDFVDINFNDYDSNIYRFRDSPVSPYYDDYKTHDDDPMDIVGHGTHCAGIAGAVTNNSIGVAGVSWDCKIMPVRTGFLCEVYWNGAWYEVGLFEYDDVKDAIEYAADQGADVISMSFGGPDSYMIKNACNYAYNKGCVLVGASGNEAKAVVTYPARYDKVIAVGAIDDDNERCSFSNRGPNLELVAPGENIMSTLPGDSYGYKGGTSMACPHAAGVAALAISRYPSYSNQQIRQLLRDSADDLGLSGRDDEYGYGRVDATLVGSGNPPPEEPRVTVTVDYVEKIDEIDPPIDGWLLWELNGRLPEWYYEISVVNLDDENEKNTRSNYNRYGEWPWQWNHENHWDVENVEHEFGVFGWYRVGIEIRLMDRDLYDFDDTADVSGDNSELVFAAIYDLSDDSVEVWIGKYIDDWEGPDNDGYIVINGELDDNPGDEDDAKIRLKISDNYDSPQASASIEDSPTTVATGQNLQFYGSIAGGAEPFTFEWRMRGPSDPTLHSTEQNPVFAYDQSDAGRSYNPSFKVIDILGYSDKGYVGFIDVVYPSIEITKPTPGHIYTFITGSDGRPMFFFGSLIMYFQYDVEVLAHAIGASKVKFILEKSGNIVNSTYVLSEDELYTYNFGKIGIGFYSITVEAYQGSNKVDSDSISKILSISI